MGNFGAWAQTIPAQGPCSQLRSFTSSHALQSRGIGSDNSSANDEARVAIQCCSIRRLADEKAKSTKSRSAKRVRSVFETKRNRQRTRNELRDGTARRWNRNFQKCTRREQSVPQKNTKWIASQDYFLADPSRLQKVPHPIPLRQKLIGQHRNIRTGTALTTAAARFGSR